MRKLLLVTLIGMVLTINLYGLISECVSKHEAKHVEETHKSYTVVYVE